MSEPLQLIDAQLRRRGDAPAFIFAGEAISWAELDRRATARAKAFDLPRGSRVACGLGAGLELPVHLLAVLRAGLVHVPVNDRYGAEEREHLIALTRPAACVGLSDAPRPAQLPCPDGAALILSTSGTTGAPKGVVHTQASIAAGIGALTEAWAWSEKDRQALALPQFHVHGLCIGLIGAMMRGVTTEFLPRFSPNAVFGAFQRGATLFMGVPTMYVALIEALEEQPEMGELLAQARLFTAGSAALSPHQFAAFERLTGHRILERYGMSETLITVSNPLDGPRQPGRIGHPISGVRCRIDPKGELLIQGPTLMAGYWQDADATEAAYRDGWFATGDRVEQGADGSLAHCGRLSIDWIKSGGWRIGAVELERLLLEHPAVREAAVLGLPDARWGEVVAAAIVPAEEGIDVEALEAWLASRVADFKKVRRWRCVDELPRNALGKVQKRRLIADWPRPRG